MNTEAAQIVDKIEATPEPEVTGEGAATDGSPQPTNSGEKVSSKIELLIRREQAALARERQAKQKEAELEAKLRAFEEKERKLSEFESVKKDPKKALGLMGITYDEITQAHLNDGELPPQVQIQKLREELESYKTQQKQAKDEEKEAEIAQAKREAQAQEQRAVQEFKSQINEYLTDNASRYEFINFENQQDLVYEVIDEHYTRTLKAAQKKFELGEISEDQVKGKIMDIKDASDKVEEHLEKKYLKAKELTKTKALWGAIPKETQKEIKEIAKPETKQQTPPRTLTNQLSATHTPPKSNRILTDEERVQKAIAYARGLRPQ